MKSDDQRVAITVVAIMSMLALPLLSACKPVVEKAPDTAADYRDGNDGKDWPGYGRTYGEQHYSPLTQITDANVGKLGLAWYYDLEGDNNSATQPIEVDGVVYVGIGHSIVHAFDVRTGKLLWQYDPHASERAGKNLRVGWGSRGVAWWDGKIYTGTQDGRLIAIDAKTGNVVWSVQTFPPDQAAYISGAPRIFDGKVIVGFGSDMGKMRGYVTAYDADTGKQIWRFWTVPGNPAVDTDETTRMAAKTWSGRWWKYGGGGTVWNAISYDPETDTVFIGTGNGYPWNYKLRSEGKGDNLFLASTVALDGKTGAYKWHLQHNPGETWDYNSAMDMELANLTIAGKPRKVLMTAPKNGFFYVIDRVSGQLISAEKIVKVNWADRVDPKTGRPVENPAAKFPDGKPFAMWPASTGAHSWPPMAYSPATRLAYIPAIHLGMTVGDSPDLRTWQTPTDRTAGGTIAVTYPSPSASDPDQMTGELMAWDPVAQKKVWGIRQPTPANGGLMATAGNLLFQGTVDGTFKAYDARTGHVLWSFDADTPIVAPPISYVVDGHQYITVITGLGTTMGIWGPVIERFNVDPRSQKRRVLTFVLDGNVTLPHDRPAPAHFAYVSGFKPDAAKVAMGERLYYQHCMMCHGVAVVGGTHAPDLRRSGVPGSHDAMASVLHDGARVSNGMPAFGELSDAEVEALSQYVLSETAKATKSKRKMGTVHPAL